MPVPWNTMKPVYCEICGRNIKINSRMCSVHSNDYNYLKRSSKKRTEEEIINKLKEKYSVKKYIPKGI